MKKQSYTPKNVTIYGVWSLSEQKLEKASLSEDEMKLELHLFYNEDTHRLVKIPVMLVVPDVTL